MKWWKKLLSRVKPPRELRLTQAGGWYLALTIAMGVVALVSGNNVLYLIESLLLSGLIFSGVLSERSIAALEVRVIRRPARAGEPTRDRIEVRNRRNYPVFCVSIEELGPVGSERLAYVQRIGAREKLVFNSTQVLPLRGRHAWQGLRLATSYPFGFANKARTESGPGERLVWPARLKARRGANWLSEKRDDQNRRRFGSEHSEGEIRPFAHGDDPRWIIWGKSATGRDPVVRVHRAPETARETVLDIRRSAGVAFEREVSRASDAFYVRATDAPDLTEGGRLILLTRRGRQTIEGRKLALDRLATIEPEAA